MEPREPCRRVHFNRDGPSYCVGSVHNAESGANQDSNLGVGYPPTISRST